MAAVSTAAGASSFGSVRQLRLFAFLPPANTHDRLQPERYRRKIKQVQDRMKEQKLDATVLQNATNVIYPPGFFHLPAERPLAALVRANGDPALFIPGLEEDQVKLWWVK